MRMPRLTAVPASLALLLSACASNVPTAALLVEQSGSNADFGIAASAGAQLAMQRADLDAAIRPIPAARLQLLEKDAASTPAAAKAVAQQLEPMALVGVGLNDSDEALAAVPVFTRAGKPFMIVGATDPSLPNRCGAGTFMACFSDDVQAKAAAQFATRAFGRRCVLVMDAKYDYTSGLARSFVQAFERLGGTVDAKIDIRSPRAMESLAALKGGTAPDFVFLSVEPDGLRQTLGPVRETLPVTPIMGGDGLDCSVFDQVPHLQSEAVFFTTHAWFG
ncbi:MAG: ABC transporter substrate-binding protein, partial [Planctomycetota bacterium]